MAIQLSGLSCLVVFEIHAELGDTMKDDSEKELNLEIFRTEALRNPYSRFDYRSSRLYHGKRLEMPPGNFHNQFRNRRRPSKGSKEGFQYLLVSVSYASRKALWVG